jgi:rhamnosyltransferase
MKEEKKIIRSNPKVSIIIRTKNEERWISLCLRSVFDQNYKNFEVILVDNNSTDRTVEIAKQFKIKIVNIDLFKPGKAINDGIRNSSGEIIACLSGHCIPVNNTWLENLIIDLSDPNVAGVYGRQQPLSFSSDFDKRDLLNLFGLDKKIQVKDSFFHNANSAIRREIWEKFPFNEDVTNIEDRVWGDEIIKSDLKIIYEPLASVYHWHGIHQDLNPGRAKNIVRIMENLENLSSSKSILSPSEQKILAIIPIRGKTKFFGGQSLLKTTINNIRESKFVNEILVSTDNEETAQIAKKLGASVPFIRPRELSENFVDIFEVVRFSISELDKRGSFFDIIIIVTENYPLRQQGVIDKMIYKFVSEGLETIIAGKEETRGAFLKKEENLTLLEEGFMPRDLKESRLIIGMVGYGCITYPARVRNQTLFKGKFGIFEIENNMTAIEIRDESIDIYNSLSNLIKK